MVRCGARIVREIPDLAPGKTGLWTASPCARVAPGLTPPTTWTYVMTEDRRSSVSPSRRLVSRGIEPSGLRELRQEVRELRRSNSVRELRHRRSAGSARVPRRHPIRSMGRDRAVRRRRLFLLAGGAVLAFALSEGGLLKTPRSFALRSREALAGLSLRQRIVAIASSQLRYATHPASSYCNKFSAYWHAGSPNCPLGEASEEWCADFAAWAWQKAGIRFAYGYGPGELNASAVSFYEWGVEHGAWHSDSSGYTPKAGDVAVYGLRLGAFPSAAHVAIVTGDSPGRPGPDVINGDGDRTGFSVVEAGTAQVLVDTGHHGGARLAGYVSP